MFNVSIFYIWIDGPCCDGKYLKHVFGRCFLNGHMCSISKVKLFWYIVLDFKIKLTIEMVLGLSAKISSLLLFVCVSV